MPSKIYLIGDPSAIWVIDPPDRVISIIESADSIGSNGFIRLDMCSDTPDTAPRPGYFRPKAVSAILPLHPAELIDSYNHLPDWLE